MSVKSRVHEIVEVAAPGDRASKAFDVVILVLIFANLAALILETVEPIRREYEEFFAVFETVSIATFTVEYALRLWSITSDPRYASPITGRLRFSSTPLLVIDLLAVLPYFLPFVGIDLRFIRAIRFFRIFRLAKLGRYSKALRALMKAMASKKEELLTGLFMLLLLLLGASTLMYYAESQAQPKHFSSILSAMWWGMATLTTVGYGDVYPATALGKVLGSVVAILGIGVFALPTGILGSAFVDEIAKARQAPKRCPHCGELVE